MSSNNSINETIDNTASANSSISGSLHDVLNIDNIDRFLQHDLNISGIALKDDCTQIFKILNEKVTSMQHEHIKLKNEVNKLKNELWDTWDSIYYVERDLANFQQYSRRENIEIIGIPDSYDDNLEFNVMCLLKRIGLPNLSSYDIIACHRLKKIKKDKPANVIVRFVNRKGAHVSLMNRKMLKLRIPEIPNLPRIY